VVVGLTDTVFVNCPPGAHEYVVAPLAVNTVDVPEHSIAELTTTVGVGFTVTVKLCKLVHPEALTPVKVYVVVIIGVAVTVVPLGELNVAAGDHVYEIAPLAVNTVGVPEHSVAFATETVGLGATVTIEVLFPLQAPLVPIIVYVVVTVGVIIKGFEFEPVLQVYELAPKAVKVAV
jgi:hypothetical protein